MSVLFIEKYSVALELRNIQIMSDLKLKQAILCVDDEKIILDSLKAQIQKQFGSCYIYELAQSSEEAFEVIRELVEDNIDVLVIVSDWLMPNMKGDEFLIAIHQKFPNITKVLLTGQINEASIERVHKEVNLHRLLKKPWEENELIEAIESGLV